MQTPTFTMLEGYHIGGESLLVLLPSEEQGMVEELNAKKIPISKIK